MFARDGNTIECPVPWEQQPVNEYQMLNETGLFAWATDDLLSFGIRMTAVTVGISAFVGYPIAALSIDAKQEFLKCCMGASCGGMLAATVVTLRLYLGWAYIGNRLFSATVECDISLLRSMLSSHKFHFIDLMCQFHFTAVGFWIEFILIFSSFNESF